MAPPFLLESIPYDPNSHRTKNILHSKNLYGPGVKFGGWQDFRGAEPVDRDPLAGEGRNLHLSHYDRLGSYPDSDEQWMTTTKESLDRTQSLRQEFEDRPQKSLVNFYSPLPCDESENPEVCPSPYGNDYRTTMQHSYQAPYPYVMKRLSLPETPFYENRRLVARAGCKFQDDDYVKQVKTLQKYKIHRDVSFDPCTCHYTDGSIGNQQKSDCVELHK